MLLVDERKEGREARFTCWKSTSTASNSLALQDK
eukprot:COSAG06_NODE_10881_length_1587_cov_1.906853_3_plen_33_part_01